MKIAAMGAATTAAGGPTTALGLAQMELPLPLPRVQKQLPWVQQNLPQARQGLPGTLAGSSAHSEVLAPLVEGGACTTFPIGSRGGGGHDGRVVGAGCDGCV
jgi:hypothetical protein